MCCLFGIMDYNNSLSIGKRVRILNVLARACEDRGTDATGISYHDGQRLCIYKRPLPAHKMHFHLPPKANVIMGHTRMTTQGDERFNQNNHPFLGCAGGERFALSHNGVLRNDRELKRTHNLPHTSIETDSYAAVQLIEKLGELTADSLALMAEAVEGSFTFTVMDSHRGIYIVKGNNPLCLYHWAELGLYVYASTEAILKKALAQIPFLPTVTEAVPIEMGDILRITADGKRAYSRFNCEQLLWAEYSSLYRYPEIPYTAADTSYAEALRSVAYLFGFSAKEVDRMLADGMSPEEIEEMYYCGAW